jgi:hypothetical protein
LIGGEIDAGRRSMENPIRRRTLGKASMAVLATALVSELATGAGPAQAYVEAPATGPTNMSPAFEDAWRKYLAVLEETRRFIFTREFSDRPQIRQEANEFLMQAQAQAYNWILAPRVDYPRFYVNTIFEPMVGTWALPCPDFRYRFAAIDGAQTYRIWGKRTNTRFLDLQLQPLNGSLPYEEFKKLPTFPYPVDAMHLEPDGSFEIIASPDHHDGNWIKLDPSQDRMMFLVREAFYDWANERPSLLRIERVADTPPASIEWGEAELIKRMEQAGRFLQYMVDDWSLGVFDRTLTFSNGQKNIFVWPQYAVNSGSNHAARYYSMVYDIGPDEALIIETDAPTSKFWNFCQADRYLRTTDYTYHQSSLNGHQARIDGDGKFRAVLTQKDPGVPNWLDPVDIAPLGFVLMRQYFQDTPVGLPSVRKVRFDEIRQNLPADTPAVAPAERARQLRDRSWAMLALYGY